jgi:hypothetical protein
LFVKTKIVIFKNKKIGFMKHFLLLIMGAFLCNIAYGQTIAPAKAEFNVDEPKVFNYTGGTGAATDWIGVYAIGETPDGDPPSLTWQYIATPAGTLSLNGDNQGAPLLAGEYAAHLFCCDGYNILASTTFKVVGEAPSALSVTSYPLFGDSIKFNYSGGTGAQTDWVGIYKKGEVPVNSTSTAFKYVFGSKEGSIKFDTAGLQVDSLYDVYFFCCDGYNALAQDSFKIYPKLTPSLAKGNNFVQNGPFSFNHQGGTGSFVDWVGIYNEGDVPGIVGSISFLYVDAPHGNVTFDAIPELVPGKKYDAHFFCCDGYDILASIKGFEVSPSSVKDIKLTGQIKVNTIGSALRVEFLDIPKGILNILNSEGRNMGRFNIDGEPSIDTQTLPTGSYYVQYVTSRGQQVIPTIIIK